MNEIILNMEEKRPTHEVIDLVLFEEEGGGSVYEGTEKECHDWVTDQGFGYEVKPIIFKNHGTI